MHQFGARTQGGHSLSAKVSYRRSDVIRYAHPTGRPDRCWAALLQNRAMHSMCIIHAPAWEPGIRLLQASRVRSALAGNWSAGSGGIFSSKRPPLYGVDGQGVFHLGNIRSPSLKDPYRIGDGTLIRVQVIAGVLFASPLPFVPQWSIIGLLAWKLSSCGRHRGPHDQGHGNHVPQAMAPSAGWPVSSLEMMRMADSWWLRQFCRSHPAYFYLRISNTASRTPFRVELGREANFERMFSIT